MLEWEPLYQTIVGVDEETKEVVLRPRSTEFDRLLRAGADITIREAEPSTALETPSLDADPLAAFEPEPEK